MPTILSKSIQRTFIELVLSRYTKKSEAIDVLCELLHVGKDAVYRRLRNETALTPEELQLLATHHQISLDALIFEQSNSVFFNYNFFNNEIKQFEDYVGGINEDLERMSQLKDPKIYYASAEIPIFYYCLFPEIISFKLFVWGHSIWDIPFVKDKTFSFDLISPATLRLTKKMYENYRRIPSVEFWSQNIVDFTLSQIEYYVVSGKFSNEADALLLCDCLLKLCEHLQIIAGAGKKVLLNGNPDDLPEPNFTLYHNEMVYTNNTILVKTNQLQQVYTAFGNPNFLTSTDEKVTDFTQKWFNKMSNKLERISIDSEKSRAWFFKGLKRRITQVRERIQIHIR